MIKKFHKFFFWQPPIFIRVENLKIFFDSIKNMLSLLLNDDIFREDNPKESEKDS